MANSSKSVIRAAAVTVALVVAAPTFGIAAQHGGGSERDGSRSAARQGRMMMEGAGSRMMDPGMMRGSMMMPEMMGHQMMGSNLGRHHGSMGHRISRRVTPAVHLTEDDVRHYFEHRLERRGNERLKVGEVKKLDDDTIVADIVTAKEGALVDSFAVDRHTGRVTRRN